MVRSLVSVYANIGVLRISEANKNFSKLTGKLVCDVARLVSIMITRNDVTIMTSSDHVTSSGACAMDSPYAICYWLYIETIPLSGHVSEIFSSKVASPL